MPTPSLTGSLLFLLLCVLVRQPFPLKAAAPARPLASTTPAPAAAAAAAQLPFVDLVIVVTNPWAWSSRRRNVFNAFRATQARTRFTAKLIYVMGADRRPAAVDASDEEVFSHADVRHVSAPRCADLDGIWPTATDGGAFPPHNSSTTCKVLEGVVAATSLFRFRYLARIGDDSYLRWDRLLETVLPPLPEAGLLMGRFNANQGVFAHLVDVFGRGRFLPYATGQGYVMTPDVAAYLRRGYLASPGLTTAGPEDAAVGLHLAPLALLNYHNEDFHDPYHRACSDTSLLVHYMSRAMWASIDEEGVVYCSNWPKRGKAPNWWLDKRGQRQEVPEGEEEGFLSKKNAGK